VGTDVVAVLDQVFEDDVLDGGDIARALKTSPRSVARWQANEVSPRRESEERLLEVKAVVDLLLQHLRPDAARLWIRSPDPNLGYEKPIDLIARGEYRRVIGVILAMAEGVTA
jgi:uncharacterized protein (DUF2384 family)